MDLEREDLMHLVVNAAVPVPATRIAMEATLGTGKTLTEIVNDQVEVIRQQMEDHLEWAMLEIHHWRERCEELEIRVMNAQNDFGYQLPGNEPVKFKSRGK